MLGGAHGRIANFELESLNLRLGARNARTSLRSEILGKFEFAIEAFEFAGPEISEESRERRIFGGKSRGESQREKGTSRRELQESREESLKKRILRRESQKENLKREPQESETGRFLVVTVVNDSKMYHTCESNNSFFNFAAAELLERKLLPAFLKALIFRVRFNFAVNWRLNARKTVCRKIRNNFKSKRF